MATMPRPQGPVGTSGLKAAAIGFAVAAVASLTFTIIMFTQKSDLEAATEQAQRQAQEARKSMDQAKQDLIAVAKEVTGKEAESLADVKSGIDGIRKTVTDDPNVKTTKMPADLPVAAMLDGLYKHFRTTADDANKLKSERDELKRGLDKTQADAKAKADAFDAQTAELTQKYDELVKQSEQFRNEANGKLAELQAARTKEREDMAKELDAARKAKDEAENTLKTEKNRTEELLSQLAQFKPSGSGGTPLQVKDGIIVRTASDGEIVYIDLGKRQNIRPGMTFSVYSPVRGIPADGKGKATIEVANVFDTTAECRVTSRMPGEPIVAEDIIANPVYDRSRQFHFAVIGDFDLNFDGLAEDTGGKAVSRLIERLGGKVVTKVDSNTDFLVLGSAPTAPLPAAAGTENEAAATERDAQFGERQQAFAALLKEAKSLSIPILTRSQFLHFLGYSMPKNTPDDKMPAI